LDKKAEPLDEINTRIKDFESELEEQEKDISYISEEIDKTQKSVKEIENTVR